MFFSLIAPRHGLIFVLKSLKWLEGDETMEQQTGKSAWSWWYLLLLVQFVFLLWVPFYNSVEPSWAGIPFFYWYQMLWVIISGVLTAIVYFATND